MYVYVSLSLSLSLSLCVSADVIVMLLCIAQTNIAIHVFMMMYLHTHALAYTFARWQKLAKMLLVFESVKFNSARYCFNDIIVNPVNRYFYETIVYRTKDHFVRLFFYAIMNRGFPWSINVHSFCVLEILVQVLNNLAIWRSNNASTSLYNIAMAVGIYTFCSHRLWASPYFCTYTVV